MDAFLAQVPFFARDVKLPRVMTSSVIPAFRVYFPMKSYDDAADSMQYADGSSKQQALELYVARVGQGQLEW